MIINYVQAYMVGLVVLFCVTMTAHANAGRSVTWRTLVRLPFVALIFATPLNAGVILGMLQYLGVPT